MCWHNRPRSEPVSAEALSALWAGSLFYFLFGRTTERSEFTNSNKIKHRFVKKEGPPGEGRKPKVGKALFAAAVFLPDPTLRRAALAQGSFGIFFITLRLTSFAQGAL